MGFLSIDILSVSKAYHTNITLLSRQTTYSALMANIDYFTTTSLASLLFLTSNLSLSALVSTGSIYYYRYQAPSKLGNYLNQSSTLVSRFGSLVERR